MKRYWWDRVLSIQYLLCSSLWNEDRKRDWEDNIGREPHLYVLCVFVCEKRSRLSNFLWKFDLLLHSSSLFLFLLLYLLWGMRTYELILSKRLEKHSLRSRLVVRNLFRQTWKNSQRFAKMLWCVWFDRHKSAQTWRGECCARVLQVCLWNVSVCVYVCWPTLPLSQERTREQLWGLLSGLRARTQTLTMERALRHLLQNVQTSSFAKRAVWWCAGVFVFWNTYSEEIGLSNFSFFRLKRQARKEISLVLWTPMLQSPKIAQQKVGNTTRHKSPKENDVSLY